IPDEMPSYTLQPGQALLDVLLATGLVSSKSEGRRLVDQKGVRLNGTVLDTFDVPITQGGVLQVGKRRFVRLVIP
ncbi:MAG: S4 domain-containing protein, partial [Anaerolineales bacterium]|nr:S4 domain-containing protein [Anaerolineales bacterium]